MDSHARRKLYPQEIRHETKAWETYSGMEKESNKAARACESIAEKVVKKVGSAFQEYKTYVCWSGCL